VMLHPLCLTVQEVLKQSSRSERGDWCDRRLLQIGLTVMQLQRQLQESTAMGAMRVLSWVLLRNPWYILLR